MGGVGTLVIERPDLYSIIATPRPPLAPTSTPSKCEEPLWRFLAIQGHGRAVVVERTQDRAVRAGFGENSLGLKPSSQ